VITPREIEDLYELTPLQEGILFHCLASPDPGLYVITLRYALRGRLDPAAFEEAWQRTVDANPVLRTSFHWQDVPKPLQLVKRHVRLEWHHLDWSAVPPLEQAERFPALVESERARGVRLDEAPLLRFTLVRTGEDRHTLVWSFHHILLEGWSAALVVGEAFTRYEAAVAGRDTALAPRRPYRDYVLWLHQRDVGRAEAFWRRTLDGCESPAPLAATGRGGVEGSGEGRRLLALSPEDSDALASFARRHKLTPSTVLQGAWAIVQSRYCGTPDVLFGTVVSGRQDTLAEAESMVGLFVNTLPARVRVDGGATVGPWLAGLQASLAEMREYEWSPLAKVQGWSGLPRGTRLFDTVFAFENWIGDITGGTKGGSLRVEDIVPVEGGIDYPLLVEAAASPRVTARFTYDRRQLDEASVARLADGYRHVLEAIVSSRAAKVRDLSPIAEPERAFVLAAGRGTATELAGDASLVRALERQAAETPDAEAVGRGDASLTFRELDRRANRLARLLQRHGAGPETPVAVLAERSLELAVALVAILKAGAAYVPLDASSPRERLSMVLADVGARVILAQGSLRALLPAGEGAVLDLKAGDEAPSEADSAPLDRAPDPDTVAYVLHTSGSTGRPKGVQVTHRSLLSMLLSLRERPGLRRDDVLLSVTAPIFDIFAVELFLPLLVGARVELASREATVDGRALASEIERVGASVLQATPATWTMLLEAGWQGRSGLRAFCGGEAMTPQLARGLRARCAAVWNLYGPTETTVYSTRHEVGSEDGMVPIGQPVGNTRVYVLDHDHGLAPIGVPGELCIGGTGVARGYLGRGDLTAERFLPDPFDPEPGARLYRTGDLARWRADGALEYLGRLDHQVKVRGFRVELGEIESWLHEHPGVGQAVVAARADEGTGLRLVAYVVPKAEGAAPAPSSLRSHLRERVPEAMVPSAFVVLARLPLTPSGKVDRRALPAPDAARPDLAAAFVPPRTAAEGVVAGIWRDVLGLERVGVDDSFFDLGGHSLLLVRVHERLRRAFPGREVSIAELFRRPTVADLAAHLAGGDAPPAVNEDAREASEVLSGRERLARRRATRQADEKEPAPAGEPVR
jgi:amino acid adenylation domain-containing protein